MLSISAGGVRPGGLRAIESGVGGNNCSPDTLYFADGINGEADWLFRRERARHGSSNVSVGPAAVLRTSGIGALLPMAESYTERPHPTDSTRAGQGQL